MLNVSGSIGVAQATAGGVTGSVDEWVDLLSGWVTELGFDTFILWPAVPDLGQVGTFGKDVAAGVRAEVKRRRGARR
jgi:hypothetical protein